MRVGESKRKTISHRSVGWLGLMLIVTPLAVAEQLPIKTSTTADGLARDSINRKDEVAVPYN
jgi:hypothetical protein